MTKWAQVTGGYHLSIRKCPNFIKMSNVQQLIVTCISMFFAQRRKQNIAFSSHFIVFYTIAYTQEYDYLKEEWAYLYPGNLQNCKFQEADDRGDGNAARTVWPMIKSPESTPSRSTRRVLCWPRGPRMPTAQLSTDCQPQIQFASER